MTQKTEILAEKSKKPTKFKKKDVRLLKNASKTTRQIPQFRLGSRK